MGTRLFVGNLSYEVREEEIHDLFKKAGSIVSCHLMIDKYTNRSRGFAFVEMGSPAEANAAISMFNGRDLGGRALVVNEARAREERPHQSFSEAGRQQSDPRDIRRFRRECY